MASGRRIMGRKANISIILENSEQMKTMSAQFTTWVEANEKEEDAGLS